MTVKWPLDHHPDHCPVHVSNRLELNASIPHVWRSLVDAVNWPQWYHHAEAVTIRDSQFVELRLGVEFHWRNMGLSIPSRVREFVPFERLAWDGQVLGVSAYHAWILQPTEKGCLVITEETQRGLPASLGRGLLQKRMFEAHQLWLEQLKEEARRLERR